MDMLHESQKANGHASRLNLHQNIHDSHLPRGGELVPYEDEYVKLNSTLQVAWSDELDEDIYTNSVRYRKVEVLMLSWEAAFDDLKVQDEISELRQVFEYDFNFHVTTRNLHRNEKRSTQAQINLIVAEFANQHEGRKTLLIVYFAGHGRPGKRGELEIAGQRSPSDLRDYLDTVVWNRTEHLLLGLYADVLQIFDCCYAGTVETRGANPGASEFLAATGAHDTTDGPGDSSFTKALIWALKDCLATKRRFTTSDLTNNIVKAPNFPQDQKPVLSKRPGDNTFGAQQLIILQPLQGETRETTHDFKPPPSDSLHYHDSGHDVVTLKFVFATQPGEDEIRKLSKDMNHVVTRNGLKVNRIMFAGIQPKRNDTVFKAISRFRALGQKSSGRRTQIAAAALIQDMEHDMEEHILDHITGDKDRHLADSRSEFSLHSAAVRAREREG